MRASGTATSGLNAFPSPATKRRHTRVRQRLTPLAPPRRSASREERAGIGRGPRFSDCLTGAPLRTRTAEWLGVGQMPSGWATRANGAPDRMKVRTGCWGAEKGLGGNISVANGSRIAFSLFPVPTHNPVTSDDDAKAEPPWSCRMSPDLRTFALFEASAHRYFP